MKRWLIAICAVAVVYGGYKKFNPAPVPPEAAEIPASITLTTDSSGQVFEPMMQLTPEARAGVDRFTTEKVVLFGASWCTYCAAERKLFAERGVKYVEIDIDENPKALRFMQNVLGVPAVPATVFGTRLVPGYNAQELNEAIRRL